VVELDVDTQGVSEAGGEDVDLLELGDAVAAGEELHEVVRVFGHRADALELDELAQRVASRWRAEAPCEEVGEAP
jgi:hypothetical protein